MNNLIPLFVIALIFLALVVGCKPPVVEKASKPLATPTATPKPTPTPTPTPTPKKLNLVEIIGKSQLQVNGLLGPPVSQHEMKPKPSFDYDFSMDYPWGHINFRYDIAIYVHYESPREYSGVYAIGESVGVDFTGATPTVHNSANVIYRNEVINGIKFEEVTVVRTGDGGYGILTFKVR
jgi:hypothetical protein